MSTRVDPADLGIVFYGSTSPAGKTYIDANLEPHDAIEIDNTWRSMPRTILTAIPSVSAGAALAMFVIVKDLGAAETVSVRCRQAYVPNPDPNATPDPNFVSGGVPVFFNMGWTLQETGFTTDVDFTLSADGAYLLQTATGLLGDQLEFAVKCSDVATVMIACKVV